MRSPARRDNCAGIVSSRRSSRVSKALVIGAGIAGLTCALALRRRGIAVTVCERAPHLHHAGGGLMLYPHGVRWLRSLGLAAGLRRLEPGLHEYQLIDDDGACLMRDGLAAYEQASGGPLFPVGRGDLQQLLLDELGPNAVQFGRRLTNICIRRDTVVGQFADGHTEHADVLIGADGIHSTVFQWLHGSCPATDLKLWFFGGILQANEREFLPGATMSVFPGCGRIAWITPMSGGRAWWYVMSTPAAEPFSNGPDKLSQVRSICAQWHRTVTLTLAVPQSKESFACLMYERPPTRAWNRDRVLVIGDAAHAFGPTAGQGANTAIEDACLLAACLAADGGSLQARIQTFVEGRWPTIQALYEIERQSQRLKVMTDHQAIAARRRQLHGVSLVQLLSALHPIVSGAMASVSAAVADEPSAVV